MRANQSCCRAPGRWVTSIALTLALAAGACSDGDGGSGVPTATTDERAAVSTTLGAVVAYDPADPALVDTATGPLRGAVDGAARRFLGIPFAAPPVGELRWRPPQPAKPWSDERDATDFGEKCPQVTPIVNAPTGIEDCLTLNVFTPTTPYDEGLPVMVWLHGGGFVLGGSSEYPADDLVAAHDVIVVTVNYRVGPFGFLGHRALEAEAETGGGQPASANLGLLDQQLALQWVKGNISRFGGDPDSVTLFGESAGGWSTCLQMLSPKAEGLFHRAIIESGPCSVPLPSHDDQLRLGDALTRKLGCATGGAPTTTTTTSGTTSSTTTGDASGTTIAPPPDEDVLSCLRATPAMEVLSAMPPSTSLAFDQGIVWGPSVDGDVVPGQPSQLLADGAFARVPVLIGSNADEGSLFTALGFSIARRELTRARFDEEVRRLVRGDADVAAVAERYPPPAGATSAQLEDLLGRIMGEGFLSCGVERTAASLAPHVPTWQYLFTYDDVPFVVPAEGRDLGAFHSAEIPYVFGEGTLVHARTPFTEDERALFRLISGAWVRFARAGNPVGEEASSVAVPERERLTGWPRRTPEGRALLRLDLAPTPDAEAAEALAETCAFWDDHGAPRDLLDAVDLS